MREFAFGTDQQFEELDQLLQDNQCHVYNSCCLPECCTPRTARIGFEQNCSGHYILYIDKGICAETDHSDFKNFIENGEIRFICIDDKNGVSSVACSAGFASCKTFGKQPKHPCFGA